MPTRPKSLLQLAGASNHPSPLDVSALLLIDHQMEYVSGNVPLVGIGGAVDEARAMLSLARARQTPVFHIVHHGRPGGALFNPQGPFVEIIPDLAPRAGEAVVIKTLPNAFAGTELHAKIQETRRKELIVIGFATHMCVSATVRAALDLGYRSTVVANATATRDLPDPLGGVISAASLQRAALAALADRFAVVVSNSAVWT
ncbi:Cysteine hydrolase [Azospirillaceae bacterium]